MNMVEIREEIDSIDAEMVKLLERRFALSLKVAQYKMERDLMILDSGREKQILDNVTADVKPPFEDVIRSLYICIMEHSRKFQHDYISSTKYK